MIYYFSPVVFHQDIVEEREALFSEAAKLRTLYIAKSLDTEVKIVSIGNTKQRKYFPKREKRINDKVKVEYIPLINYFNLKHLFFLIYITYFIVKNVRKSDKILVYNAMPEIILPILLAKIFKKLDFTLEIEELQSTVKYYAFKAFVYSHIERIALRTADRFIVVSGKIGEKVCEKGAYIISKGYYTNERFSNSQVHEKTPRIVYSGRLDYEGGVEIFLEALAYLKSQCVVCITGKGELESRMDEYKEKVPTHIKLEWLGFLERERYVELMKGASLCVNPLRINEAYGAVSFSSKVLQYLQFGNLVVSSFFYGLNEIGSLEKYVTTYDRDDPKLLAEKIDESLNLKISKKAVMDEVGNYFKKDQANLKKFLNSNK